MKKILLIALLAISSTTPAYADGGNGRGGGHGGGGWWIVPVLIGGALLYELTQPQPAYSQPAPVYVDPAPAYAPENSPVNDPEVVFSSEQYWYFCAAANGYYPYVRSCPGGWQAVPTTPRDALPSAPYGAPGR